MGLGKLLIFYKMATILDKDLVRESKVKIGEREVVVTLTEKQSISLKLKGMKSGDVSIGIEELYNQLSGVKSEEKPSKSISISNEKNKDDEDSDSRYTGGIDLSGYKGQDRYLISLHDIRHAMHVKNFDMPTRIAFESFLVELINERKPKKK
jgi:hypothetical protein